MKRVIGLGGIFFKAKDPKALYEWYRRRFRGDVARRRPPGSSGLQCVGDLSPGDEVLRAQPVDNNLLHVERPYLRLIAEGFCASQITCHNRGPSTPAAKCGRRRSE